MSGLRLKQDGIVVASVDGEDEARARSEIDHYAVVYMQDGPVTIEQRVGKRWKPIVLGAKVSRP